MYSQIVCNIFPLLLRVGFTIKYVEELHVNVFFMWKKI